MNRDRETLPPEAIARIREVGNLAVLAGLKADELIEVLNVVAREYGMEYRRRVVQQ